MQRPVQRCCLNLLQQLRTSQQQIDELQLKLNETKQQLSFYKREYRKYVPARPFIETNINEIDPRPPPGPRIKNRVLDFIVGVLKKNTKYCYGYWDIMELFDEILGRVGFYTHRICDCLDAADAVQQYLNDIGTATRKPSLLRDKQAVCGAMMLIQNNWCRNIKLFKRGSCNILPNAADARKERLDFVEKATARRIAFNQIQSIQTLNAKHMHSSRTAC